MAYELSFDAKEDLREIVQYTLDKWGVDAVDAYVSELLQKLDAIGKGNVVMRKYPGKFANLYVARFRFHSIYFRVKANSKPEIARILHDKQDRVRHLQKTLKKLH